MVLYFFLHALYAFSPIIALSFSLIISVFIETYQSFIFEHKRPVLLCIITFWKAPKLLDIVGTLTNEASTHLFSLLPALKIVFSIGAILISTDEIIPGNFVQSVKFFFIILDKNSFKKFGNDNSPKNSISIF